MLPAVLPQINPKEVISLDPQKLKKLADLLGHDLAGWKITQCHFLELEHRLRGSFPAITNDGKVIATLDKSLLQKVWKRLSRRAAKVTSLTVIAHPESGVAFSLENYFDKDVEPSRVLSSEAIEELCRKKHPFQWTPNLLQMSERPIHDPVFTD